MVCVLEDHYNGIIGDNLVMSMQVFRGFLWKPAGNWEEGTSLLCLLPLWPHIIWELVLLFCGT